MFSLYILCGYFLIAVAKILGLLINLYTLIVAVAVLLSWVKPDPYNPLVRTLHQLTEPVFGRVRRFLPKILFRTGLDFSPILVLIILIFLDTFLVESLSLLGKELLQAV